MKLRIAMIPVLAVAMGVVIYAGSNTLGQEKVSPESKVIANQSVNETIQPKEYKIATNEAKLIYYKDFNLLDSDTEIVAIGHVVNDNGLYDVKTDEGVVVDQLSQTSVKIDEVLKGEIPTDNPVTVMESAVIKDDVFVTLEGYVKMNDEDQYLLFLRKTGDNTYAINGTFQGKFNIEQTSPEVPFQGSTINEDQLDKVEYIGDQLEHFNTLKEEALSKYVK